MSTRQLRSATKATGDRGGTLGFKQNKATVAVPAVTKKPTKERIPRATKRERSPLPVDGITASTPSLGESTATVDEKKSNPKRQKLNKFPDGTTPFPDHPHPTPEEVQEVVDLLSGLHGVHARPLKPPRPNLLVAGCGEVPSVLDALIRTLLSASTSAQNSNRAFKGLVEKFGVCGRRGSVDWEKVRRATNTEVFDAIKPGGLANVKSKRIQKILQQLANGKNSQPGNKNEIDYESENDLSLDYLHNLPNDAAMDKLTSFDGIGFKTASCVMLFCMSRDSFAVDTHVFRLARFLNWVPPDKANRETAFWHLDAKLPGEHKYALHQLFIKHGRTCKWCKAGGPLKYEDYGKKSKEKKEEGSGVKKEEGVDTESMNEDNGVEEKVEDIPEKCPIEHLVKRFHGASKGRGAKWE
ncbi:DNA glycosylase [Tirmania nivea]|nr:DNA glycosylase [Tirmania nivea]